MATATSLPELTWSQTEAPIMLEYNCKASDSWLRQRVKGDPYEPPSLQRVILQGSLEVERVRNALAQLKYARGHAYGGSQSQTLQSWKEAMK